jgi:hypothetical protein
MKINLAPEAEAEVQFFIDKFVELGWKQEDVGYITKDVGFLTNPEAHNEEWKTSVGMVLFPSLLSYTEKTENNGKRKYEDILTVWIECRLSIDINPDVKYPDACPRLRQLAEYMKEEIKKTGHKAFYDEDSFLGNFSRPEKRENLGDVRISFFLNKDYTGGYWGNHTL